MNNRKWQEQGDLFIQIKKGWTIQYYTGSTIVLHTLRCGSSNPHWNYTHMEIINFKDPPTSNLVFCMQCMRGEGGRLIKSYNFGTEIISVQI